MKLHSKKYGDKGQDLIVIHGLFGMSDNWNTLGKQFSKYCKVHLVDLRNHGRSPHSVEFNYQVMSDDLKEYIEDNNISNPIILGHSLGGKIAIKFAFTHPDKIEKLIVADISPRKYNTDRLCVLGRWDRITRIKYLVDCLRSYTTRLGDFFDAHTP